MPNARIAAMKPFYPQNPLLCDSYINDSSLVGSMEEDG
jgi:hypothetical protein